MKKLIIILVLFLIVGCSSSSNEHINESEQYLGEAQETIGETIPKLDEQEVPILYDKAEGWGDVRPLYDSPIQIDDLFIKEFLTVEEFIKLLNTSENKYEHSINENGLLSSKGTDSFVISRILNGSSHEWIKIKVKNIYDETVSVLKGIVSFVSPTDESLPYCRFVDGRSYVDLISMNYSEVIEYMHEMENTFTYSFNWEDFFSGKVDPEWFDPNANFYYMEPGYFFWEEGSGSNAIGVSFSAFVRWPRTGYKAVLIDDKTCFSETTYYFTISKNDGQVTDFGFVSRFEG